MDFNYSLMNVPLLAKPSTTTRSPQQLQTAWSCYTYICAAANPLQDLPAIWPPVDLRENGLTTAAKNQGQCGCCWAFSTVAVLETCVLRDQGDISQNIPAWRFSNTTLNISEQFVISNDFGSVDRYCNGGNPLMAWVWLSGKNITIETAADYPYSYQQWQSNWQTFVAMPDKLAQSAYYIPFQTFGFQGSASYNLNKTPSVLIYNDYTTQWP